MFLPITIFSPQMQPWAQRRFWVWQNYLLSIQNCHFSFLKWTLNYLQKGIKAWDSMTELWWLKLLQRLTNWPHRNCVPEGTMAPIHKLLCPSQISRFCSNTWQHYREDHQQFFNVEKLCLLPLPCSWELLSLEWSLKMETRLVNSPHLPGKISAPK